MSIRYENKFPSQILVVCDDFNCIHIYRGRELIACVTYTFSQCPQTFKLQQRAKQVLSYFPK